jgi:AcrR family transcriptional regulator
MSAPRDRIVAAARELFLEEGTDAVTMRAVAERVGVTATALYRHFDDKTELLNAVLRAGFETFGSYLYRALEGKDPGERLRRSGESYLAFGLEQPQVYRTLFMSSHPVEGVDCATATPTRSATFRFLVDRVRECMESRTLREADPEEVALVIWAQVHGLISLYLSGTLGVNEKQFREMYQRALERLFLGLLP